MTDIATDRVNSGHIRNRNEQATSDEPKRPHRHRSVGLVGRRSGALVKVAPRTRARSTRSRLYVLLQQADIGHALALLAHVAKSKKPEVAEVLDAMRFEGWEPLLVPAARRVRNQPRASADLARKVVECLPRVMRGLASEVESIAFDAADRELPEHVVSANVGSVRHLASEKGRSIVRALNMARLPLDYSRAGAFVERYVARALQTDGRIDPDRVAEDALVTLGGFAKKAANNAINNARFERRR